MALTLESICRYEQDFLNTVADATRFIDELKVDNLKAHLDTFHMNIEEESIENTIVRCKDYIGHVHLADSNRWHPGCGHKGLLPYHRAAGHCAGMMLGGCL
jgi:sugar phosphate isomerase/epimerase